MVYSRLFARLAVAAGVVLVAGCTVAPAKKNDSPPDTACKPAASNDPLIGNWLSVRKQSGVSGELHTLFTLNADGTMVYSERLKRGRGPSQGIAETGCWERQADALQLRTLTSNGLPVDLNDPIYVNRYHVVSGGGSSLQLGYQGITLKAKKMPLDYRLPL